MNLDGIKKIEDHGLHEIRLKYWNLKHKAFLDEHGVPDEKLGEVCERLDEEEEKEIAKYLKEQEEQTNA